MLEILISKMTWLIGLAIYFLIIGYVGKWKGADDNYQNFCFTIAHVYMAAEFVVQRII